jgi:hypothetical protein
MAQETVQPEEDIRVRVRWSEVVWTEATRELDAARIRRLGYDPADVASLEQYLTDADDFTGDDWYPWHSEFAGADNARRIDAGDAEICAVVIEYQQGTPA